ncbi:hypothetical protein IV203_022185 [Nitzschia inconspicua]|uniref:Uncharacterized protein n=1 Tax=Nitzschia inconspicua TaxID=303405 RepID=A0A9K3KI56_9STRA|nr:hypothetical protein IV203_022185 [Nitzschia inconspicua]
MQRCASKRSGGDSSVKVLLFVVVALVSVGDGAAFVTHSFTGRSQLLVPTTRQWIEPPSSTSVWCSNEIDSNDIGSVWLSHQDVVTPLLPALGSSLIMLTIVGLLYMWEESVEWMRESVPKTIKPVVDSILAEIGGLGFIGLILQSVLGNGAVKEGLEGLSMAFFQEKDTLVENFEFLHTAFFQVGIGFFIAAGAMTVEGIKKLNEIKTVEGLEVDAATGACLVTPTVLCKYIPVKETNQNAIPGGNILWDELFMKKEERAGRVLLIRIQLMKLFPHLQETFRVETVVQASFAQNLYKVVELSPLTWIYLIPALSLANALDLSHDVINSASPNAADSVGYFFSTRSVFGPSLLSVTLSVVWGVWNCWKLTKIKYMIMPRLGKNAISGETEVLPPLMDSKSSRQAFHSSPAWVRPIERIWSKPAITPLDELFGEAGRSGMKMYQTSIKYQTWLCLTHIVFFGTQIIPRDIVAIWTGATVGDPDHLIPELVAYSIFVLASLFQLSVVSPRAFWNFCLIQSLEEESSKKLLVLSGNDHVPDQLNGSGSILIAEPRGDTLKA